MRNIDREIKIMIGNFDESIEQMHGNPQNFAHFFNDDSSQSNELNTCLHEEVVNTNYHSLEETLKSYLATNNEVHNQQINFFSDEERSSQSQKEQERTEADIRPKKYQKVQPKSSLYSKNYREKKRQRMKVLEQQNQFLKKKVAQLQFRLREKEMQINRLKFTSTEQFQMRKLNQDIMNKLKIISQHENSNSNQPMKQQNEYKEGDKKIEQFIKIFDTYGMGGTQSKQLLEYYINEFIQNVMRDGEKYNLLTWMKKQYSTPVKTAFDIQFQQAFPWTEQQKKQIMQMSIQIVPLTMKLLNSCKEIHKIYKQTIQALEKIHQIIRECLPKNIQYTQKRMKSVIWFQNNRYRKEMRQIREQWLNLVKSQDNPWLNQKTNTTKKKLSK